MSDLTDLEICNLIAEIEETPHWQHLGKVVLRAPWSWDKEALEAHIYNPLTDDALCFKFAVNDKMMLSWVECPAGSGKAYFVNVGDKSTHYHGTPNRAVCMAKLKVFRDE